MRPERPPWEQLPAETLPALAPALPALADEIVDRIRAEVPSFDVPLDGAFGQLVRRGVNEAFLQFETMVRRPGTGRTPGRSVYVAFGAAEVREGRSLDALLAAYRVGAKVAWRRLAATGAAAGLSTDTLVLLAESIFAYIDELSAESAEGYAAEQALRAGESDRRRRALIELLVAVPAPSPEALAVAAERARTPLPRTLAVAVWPAADGGRRRAAALPADAISATVDAMVVAVLPDPAGRGRRAALARALDGVPAGVGPTVAPSDGGRSHARAVATLALAQAAPTPGPLFADEHRVALLLAADPVLVAEIASDVLAPLADESALSRERLTETLREWLRHDRNATAAAAALHVHAQTVRYRLARLRELFGDGLDDAELRFRLELVLRAGVPG
jgi:hypothetical protein